MIQQFLPGFEFMADDDYKKYKAKEIQRMLDKVQKEYEALQGHYSSPFKVIGYQKSIQSLKKQQEDLWKVPQKE